MTCTRSLSLIALLLCIPLGVVSRIQQAGGDFGGFGNVMERIDRTLGDLATVTCREEVHRYQVTQKSSRADDVITMLVDDVNGIEKYSEIHKLNFDGTPRGHKQYPAIPELGGSYSYGEFYSVLKKTSQALSSDTAASPALFDPGSGLLRIPFRCVGECWVLQANSKLFWANIDGEVRADPGTSELREVSWLSSGLPLETGVESLELRISYAPTEIAGQIRVVPVHAFYRVRYLTPDRVDWNMTEFSEYRRFGSESSLNFVP